VRARGLVPVFTIDQPFPGGLSQPAVLNSVLASPVGAQVWPTHLFYRALRSGVAGRIRRPARPGRGRAGTMPRHAMGCAELQTAPPDTDHHRRPHIARFNGRERYPACTRSDSRAGAGGAGASGLMISTLLRACRPPGSYRWRPRSRRRLGRPRL